MSNLDRRRFIQATAASGLALTSLSPSFAQEESPNEKLNIACVGVANKGGHNVDQLTSQNIVAICDVDENFLNRSGTKFPKAKKYRDYRKLMENAKDFDAVVVSTADHCHAPVAAAALELGKHVYCEKPLSHTVREARVLANLAAKHKVATQMGTQIHAQDNYRRVVEFVQSGKLGPIKDVYCWCNKGWSNGRFSDKETPVPKNLDWDLWLGPAKERKYSPNVHPANWRRFWEYGSGTFGDMACHIMDLPFWALGLRSPTKIEAEGPELHPVGTPSWVKAKYQFDKSDSHEALTLYWSDGGKHFPMVEKQMGKNGKSLKNWGIGALFVGEKAMLAADYGHYEVFPIDKDADLTPPEKSIPSSIGHWNEWVKACKDGSATTCNFDYSGRLTETVLLGIVAYRAGVPLEFDPKEMKATNTDKAEEFLTKEYRKGFGVKGA